MALNFSLGKKAEAKPVEAPLWHPDFRDLTGLPDTKVVRTTFFVNTAAIAVAVALLGWAGYQEYNIYSLSEQVNSADQQIERDKRANTEALRLTKIFSDEQKKLAEVETFQKTPVSPVEFLSLLAQSLPPEISIETVDMRYPDPNVANAAANASTAGGFQLRALVAGSPDQASGVASRYVDILRAHPKIGTIFEPITLTNLNRNTTGGGYISVDIALKFKTDGKK